MLSATLLLEEVLAAGQVVRAGPVAVPSLARVGVATLRGSTLLVLPAA